MFGHTRKIMKRFMICVAVVFFLLANTYTENAYAEYHHVNGCTSCHNFNKFGSSNFYLISDQMQTPNSGVKPVIFTALTGPNSFADGDAVYDGVCEVCHTQTRHHRNDGSDNSAHFDGENCIACHTHEKEFSANFSPSHVVHLSVGRRSLDCVDCHETIPFQQQTVLFADGKPFADTGVCDRCHSPGGNYDGVNDPVIGAKSNWAEGVHEPNYALKPGKEYWCLGCHDGRLNHARNGKWCLDCHTSVSSRDMFK